MNLGFKKQILAKYIFFKIKINNNYHHLIIKELFTFILTLNFIILQVLYIETTECYSFQFYDECLSKYVHCPCAGCSSNLSQL
jgi:hypothetical protein